MTEETPAGPTQQKITAHHQEERRQAGGMDEFFNAQFDATPLMVEPGSVQCVDYADQMLVATVSSGILMTIFDAELKTGAMAYVLLPRAVLDCFPFLDQADPELVKKAFEPIEGCIGEMKNRGAGKNRISIRLFGGMMNDEEASDDGIKTCVFVQEYMYRKGLQVSNVDIGGPHVRRIHFFPTTGRAIRLILKRQSDVQFVRSLESDFDKKIASNT